MSEDARSEPGVGQAMAPSLPSPRFAQVVRPLLAALGSVLLFLALYEVVERNWLSGLDREILRPLRITRGAIAILVLATGIAWMILRASPKLLVESSINADEFTPARPTATEQNRIFAWWFICMRWIVVMLAAILVCMSVWVFRWLSRDVWWPLVMAVVALGGVNVLYMLLLHRKVGLAFWLPMQGFVDLGLLTLFLHFSGGLENPLCMIVIFHVIIGGIVLSRPQCYAMAATASGLLLLMGVTEWLGLTCSTITWRFLPMCCRTGAAFTSRPIRSTCLARPACRRWCCC